MKPTRRRFLRAVSAAGVAGFTGPTTVAAQSQDESGEFNTIRVPQTHPTIHEGIENAAPGDLVLVDEGTYAEAVEVTTPNLTIRGTNRNAVVLDGEFERQNAIDVEADGVAVENMAARHYTHNGFYWRGVEGFRGSYLTAYNNADYGIYAYGSRDGRFEYSYASGHADAGFYLGRNRPFDAVISDVIAERNALGYSGTSTGENLTIQDSLWHNNAAGIVPNTLDEHDPPQRASRIVGNVVLDNDNADAPNRDHTYPNFGTGILAWGGNDNLIAENFVAGHENCGIAAHYNVDEPSGNVVRGNTIWSSGIADLALGTPAGSGNRFEHNGFATSLPEGIEQDASSGSEQVTEVYERQKRRAEGGDFPAGDWRTQPVPADQPPMPNPSAPPRPARRDVSLGE